jgi:hypothetical protein
MGLPVRNAEATVGEAVGVGPRVADGNGAGSRVAESEGAGPRVADGKVMGSMVGKSEGAGPRVAEASGVGPVGEGQEAEPSTGRITGDGDDVLPAQPVAPTMISRVAIPKTTVRDVDIGQLAPMHTSSTYSIISCW